MGRMRPIYIVLRQSPDWSSQTYTDLERTRDFCRMIGRPETFIIDRVKLWDGTFGVSFFQARQVMKEISLESFSAVHGAAALMTIEQARENLDRGAFYLFTDDDDWYHPDVARNLASLDPAACDAVLWPSALFGNGYVMREADSCYTNTYAVSGEVLLQKRGNLDRVYQHYDANATLIRSSYRSVLRRIGYGSLRRRLFVRGYRSLYRLKDHLSVTNKHPAAISSLAVYLQDDLTSDRLLTVIRQAYEANTAAAIPEAIRWARPYIERVNTFLARLLASVRTPDTL